ncbi:MAG: Gfo/Idh/MocA family protein [Planctomycetota bacterium]|jgi:predicted dehydrogenase
MKIGIIGAENSHTAAIAKVINVDKKVKGFTVDYVWGETDDFAKAAAKAGSIPNIVKKPAEMMGKIDAVICDHRHPKFHLKSVTPFIKAGIPTFVDKPLCYRAKEGKEFFALAKKCKTPVTSFSVLNHQKSFAKFVKKAGTLGEMKTAAFYGPSDLKSPYGGVFFYGIHQIDIALDLCGEDVKKVLMTKNGENATGQLMYADGRMVTINLVKAGMPGSAATFVGTGGTHHAPITMDASPYLEGVKTFTKMFKTGKEPISYARMLKPVQVLEALQKSQTSGKVEKV